MGRPKSDTPKLYQLKDGTYAVNFSGKRYRLGRDAKTAREHYRRLLAEHLAGRPLTPPSRTAEQAEESPTVEEAAARYLLHVTEASGSKSQIHRVRFAMEKLTELYGTLRAADLDRGHVRTLRTTLLASAVRSQSSPAIELMRSLLANGPRRSEELSRRFELEGWSRSRYRQVRRSLDLISTLDDNGVWWSSLPQEGNVEGQRLLSRRYVNALITVIQTAWRWLEQEEILPAGAAASVISVRGLKRLAGGREVAPVVAVPAEAVELTLPYASPYVAPLIRLQRLTGMRPGEVCAMRGCDISRSPEQKLVVPLPGDKSMRVGAVRVGEQTVWIYIPGRHKNSHRYRPRVIPLNPEAQEILRPLLESRPLGEPLLLTSRGKPWNSQEYAKAVRDACQRGGIPRWAPNQIRHLVATEVNDEMDLDSAAALLGHASPDTTTIYAELAILKAARAVLRKKQSE